ncbi:porin [Undibacterium arcticum]|uniref:Porin n=1 Tax=Undibacterium arcticum TaxID=1762892 RepID=A0ABV7F1L5_9BURK
MKKIHVVSKAVAVTGLLLGFTASDAVAQASVQVYGLVGAYVGSAKRSGDASSVLQEGGGGLTTSYLGFKGNEDLGSGYKAVFALESFFRPDTGEQGRSATDPFFARNAWVGIEGGFGRVTLGRQTNPTYTNMATLSPFGSSVVFSPLVLQSFVATYGSAIVGDTVWNNVIEYTSPNLGGFKGAAVYGSGEVPGQPGIANMGLHGSYTQGPFTAALSAQRVRVNTPSSAVSQQDAYLGGVTYDFKLLKIYTSLEKTSSSSGIASKTYDAGLSIPITKNGSLLAEVARTKVNAPKNIETARTTASIGYDHFLSKRTDVYAIYVFDKKSNAGSAGTVGVGMRHTF